MHLIQKHCLSCVRFALLFAIGVPTPLCGIAKIRLQFLPAVGAHHTRRGLAEAWRWTRGGSACSIECEQTLKAELLHDSIREVCIDPLQITLAVAPAPVLQFLELSLPVGETRVCIAHLFLMYRSFASYLSLICFVCIAHMFLMYRSYVPYASLICFSC